MDACLQNENQKEMKLAQLIMTLAQLIMILAQGTRNIFWFVCWGAVKCSLVNLLKNKPAAGSHDFWKIGLERQLQNAPIMPWDLLFG